MPNLDAATGLGKVACHLLLCLLAAHIRDVLVGSNLKKWKFGQIRRDFSLFTMFLLLSFPIVMKLCC
jgi:hypothetical protein